MRWLFRILGYVPAEVEETLLACCRDYEAERNDAQKQERLLADEVEGLKRTIDSIKEGWEEDRATLAQVRDAIKGFPVINLEFYVQGRYVVDHPSDSMVGFDTYKEAAEVADLLNKGAVLPCDYEWEEYVPF